MRDSVARDGIVLEFEQLASFYVEVHPGGFDVSDEQSYLAMFEDSALSVRSWAPMRP
jgi:hypothetical protein